MTGLFNTDGSVNRAYVPDFSNCLLPYCTWYQDDFLGGVRGMTASEIGVYTVLLNEMYARVVALPLDHARLARACGLPSNRFRPICEMLLGEGKLILLACGLWNERVEVIWLRRKNERQSKSKGGTESAKKRSKIKERIEQESNSSATPVQVSSEAQKLIKNNTESPPPLSTSEPRETAAEDDFHDMVLRAVGHDPDASIPEYWRQDRAVVFYEAWRASGLGDAEIVATAKATRTGHPEPPMGPKALNAAMEEAAKPKVTGKEIDARISAAIRDGKTYLLRNTSPATVTRLLVEHLVTEEQCRAVGLL